VDKEYKIDVSWIKERLCFSITSALYILAFPNIHILSDVVKDMVYRIGTSCYQRMLLDVGIDDMGPDIMSNILCVHPADHE